MAAERAELVTVLVAGCQIRVIERAGDWAQVETDFGKAGFVRVGYLKELL